MKKLRKLRIQLHSNIKNYKLLIYDGNVYSYIIINDFNDIINIYTDSLYLIILGIPLLCDNNTNIYFKLNIKKKNYFNLYLNFSKQSNTNIDLNTFYLRDKTYGIPLNGTLYFKTF